MLKSRVIAASWALVLAGLSSGAGAAVAGSPTRVSGAEISVLLRTTVVALDQANVTGNYSVLRDLGDTPFQNNYTQSALADMFRAFREQQVSLGAVVLFDAELDASPQLTEDGYLKLMGHFPTAPQNVIFDITYRNEGGPWRIDGINIGMRPAADAGGGLQLSETTAPAPAPLPKWRQSTGKTNDGGI